MFGINRVFCTSYIFDLQIWYCVVQFSYFDLADSIIASVTDLTFPRQRVLYDRCRLFHRSFKSCRFTSTNDSVRFSGGTRSKFAQNVIKSSESKINSSAISKVTISILNDKELTASREKLICGKIQAQQWSVNFSNVNYREIFSYEVSCVQWDVLYNCYGIISYNSKLPRPQRT